jgi:hypothetical protein
MTEYAGPEKRSHAEYLGEFTTTYEIWSKSLRLGAMFDPRSGQYWKSSVIRSCQSPIQFHGEQRSRTLERQLDDFRAYVVARAHLTTKLGGPTLHVPLQAFGGDECSPKYGKDTDILGEIARL